MLNYQSNGIVGIFDDNSHVQANDMIHLDKN